MGIGKVLTIAVVDDDDGVRKALTRLLCGAAYAVEGYASGSAFLHSLDDHEPDCVLLDLHMPGISGFDVQDAIVASHAGLPVVIITGYETPASRARALHGGAADVLFKPVNETTLFAAIEAAVAGAGSLPRPAPP